MDLFNSSFDALIRLKIEVRKNHWHNGKCANKSFRRWLQFIKAFKKIEHKVGTNMRLHVAVAHLTSPLFQCSSPVAMSRATSVVKTTDEKWSVKFWSVTYREINNLTRLYHFEVLTMRSESIRHPSQIQTNLWQKKRKFCQSPQYTVPCTIVQILHACHLAMSFYAWTFASLVNSLGLSLKFKCIFSM